jgi:hypothetical protein
MEMEGVRRVGMGSRVVETTEGLEAGNAVLESQTIQHQYDCINCVNRWGTVYQIEGRDQSEINPAQASEYDRI